MTKFIMKNGCCRECMKAFSKNGKVSIRDNDANSLVYAKCLDFREELRFQRTDASTADAKDATQLTFEETRDRRSRIDSRKKASITLRGRDCSTLTMRTFSFRMNTMIGIMLRKSSLKSFRTLPTSTCTYLELEYP